MFDTTAAKMALAIAVTSVAIAVAVAPSLIPNAHAVKTETPAECTGNSPDPTDCPGESGGQNPNRDQIECSVTGGGGAPVPGQEKKVC